MPKASRDSLNAKGKRDAYMFDPEDLVLVTDEKHPLYDPRVHLPVDENLVLNMMFCPDGKVPQGVLEPISGVRDPETGKVLVVIGRQRTKACREANKRLKKRGLEPLRIPAMLVRADAVRGMGMLISENEHRQNDTPLGRAEKMARYMGLGRDEAEVATLFGISEASVKNHLSLLDAPSAIRDAVETGKITVSSAYKLAKMEPGEAKDRLAELMEHAPREPGKKRSKNGAKARNIVNGGGKGDVPKISKKGEDAVATDIAAWIDQNFEDFDPSLIKGIRSGSGGRCAGRRRVGDPQSLRTVPNQERKIVDLPHLVRYFFGRSRLEVFSEEGRRRVRGARRHLS